MRALLVISQKASLIEPDEQRRFMGIRIVKYQRPADGDGIDGRNLSPGEILLSAAEKTLGKNPK
ncbi:MAG: hypothetical protein ACREQV_12325, partial [Candidatus Binatia bacterium]